MCVITITIVFKYFKLLNESIRLCHLGMGVHTLWWARGRGVHMEVFTSESPH